MSTKSVPRRIGTRKTASTLLSSLAARRSLSTLELTSMVLPPYAVLDAIHRGHGSVELLSTMAEYTIFSELLAARIHAARCGPTMASF
jgi:hypothetical protein